MNDTQKPHSFFPRPSGPSVFFTFLAIIGCFLALALVVYLAYLPNRDAGVSVTMSQVSEEMRWKFTADGRKTRLDQMRADEIDLLGNYAWIDQSAGVVRVPVERAMELVVEERKGAKR